MAHSAARIFTLKSYHADINPTYRCCKHVKNFNSTKLGHTCYSSNNAKALCIILIDLFRYIIKKIEIMCSVLLLWNFHISLITLQSFLLDLNLSRNNVILLRIDPLM